MRPMIFNRLALGLVVLAAAACTSVEPDQVRASAYTLCLEPSGATQPSVCRLSGLSSRLAADEGLCVCHGGAMTVKAPVCAEGEREPAETRAFELARRDAAKDGSLVGDLYEGQAMCVAPRSQRRGL